MGRFVSATGQFLLTAYGQSSCPPTGSFRCPLTDRPRVFKTRNLCPNSATTPAN
jgi:hypothetical protein